MSSLAQRISCPRAPPSPLAGSGELDLFERLDSEVRAELAQAYAPKSDGPLGTAWRSFAKFARRVPNRQLFKQPRATGDLAAEAWNEWTLVLWAWDEGRGKSAKTGRPLLARSIEQRVSLLKGLLSHRYGFAIAGAAPRLKSLLSRMKDKDPLGRSRKKRRGLRRRHLIKGWEGGWRAKCAASSAARHEWAALTTSWHVLARGGELAGILRSDVQFKTARGGGRRYVIVWVQPLKKRGDQARQKLPQFIAERPGEEWEPYAALRRVCQEHDDAGRADEAPLLRVRGGAATTARYRALVRRFVVGIGMPPAQFGAQSTRIGGASDLASTGEASQLLLQAKGRWASDIARIYARMTRRAHLAASDLMHAARGRDLEELIPGFVEPA